MKTRIPDHGRRRRSSARACGRAAILVGAALVCGGRLPATAVKAQSVRASQDAGWLSGAQRSIAEREYEASQAHGGLQAPNRAHNLRVRFAPDGVRLHDRTADGEPELMALRLARLGRAGSEQPVPAGTVANVGPRVEIRRPGVVEWYVNGSAGLEQGFTLDERPSGAGKLSLRLALSAGSARSAGPGAALLRAPNGRELRYGGLAALDAQGAIVLAELYVSAPDELCIQVDDSSTVYPLTIDPLFSAVPDATLQGNQAGAGLGASVAGAGDVNGDGYADVIVGAPRFDAGQVDEGAAFVFLGGPTGIASGGATSAGAVLAGDQANALMGSSVASAGDVNGDGYDDVIVGAPDYDAGQTDEGAAFVFLGSASGVLSSGAATASAGLRGAQAEAAMGSSVASAGDVNGDGYDDVMVGATYYDAGQVDEGGAFVFLGGPLGIASGSAATAATTLQSNQEYAALGISVAGAGDVNGDGYDDVIVGAYAYDEGQSAEGEAFVFLGGPTGIPNGTPTTADARIQPDVGSATLGHSVAAAGDVNADGYDDVIVGAPGLRSALIFLGSATGVPNGSLATASTVLHTYETIAQFGWSVSGAGDVDGDGYDDVIVGDPLRDFGSSTYEGAAYVFLSGPAGVPSTSDLTTAVATLRSGQGLVRTGASVAGAGDVDGDGFADLLVGVPGYASGEGGEGGVLLYLGGFVKGDFNRDRRTDLVLRHQPSGANMAWLMNGTTRASLAPISPDPVGLDQRIAGIDDFNGDWKNDLVLWNPVTGATEFWLMNGGARTGAAVPLASPLLPPWKPSATADFDHDHKPDLVWRNVATQKIEVWTMNGMVKRGTLVPTPDQAVDANWEIVATLDWNGDHHTDFLWYNATSGKIVLWFMDAALHRITGQFTSPPNAGDNNWNVVAAGDYGVGANGLVGTKDIVWRNATSGNLVVWHMDRAGNRTAGGFTNPAAPNPNPTDWTVVGPR